MPARAVTTLPEGYSPRFVLGPEKSWNTFLGLAMIGAVLVSVAWMLFATVASLIRPDVDRALANGLAAMAGEMGEQLTGGLEYAPLLWMCSAVLAFILLVAIHEGTHAVFFWAVTGRRPSIGFTGNHAYVATCSSVYVARDAYLMGALAPLVLLTLLGVALIAVVPISFVWVLAMFVVFNAGGAVSDVRVAAWLLSQPRSALVQDRGDTMTVFAPAPAVGRGRRGASTRRADRDGRRRARRTPS